ncbi:MAG: leucine-rich repeat domain-containing protein [Paludibacteraceae bacterium]|nr:leucine-rich repeat domain-containing protein [Paludibacteraceae bacterium]
MERNFKNILLLLLIGAAGTAYAWEDCGTNIQYEIQGSTLVLNSPDPDQPATIVSEAFKNNTEITSVTLPENVTTIEGQAFMGCTALTDLDLGSVQQISSYAFEGCTSVDNVVIPPTVTNIDAYAFYGCTALHNVLCRPYYAPDLGTDAFTQCHTSLQICVPALGTYRNQTNWTSYYENTVLTDCEFLDESDELSNTEAKINDYRSTSTSVTLFRTLRKAGCFNTLTLPFSVPDINASPLGGDNVEVYTFTDAAVENGTLVFDITKVNTNRLEAGVPYLIQWNNTGEVITRMDFTDIDGWDNDNTAETTNGTGVTYHGFYGKTHMDDETSGEQHLNLFLGGGNQLYWPEENDATSMLGFRAWFQIINSGASLAPIRRGMPATLRIVATPTAIDEISSSLQGEDRGRLVLRNGQLVIIRNGQTFSLNGQKL